MKDDIFNFFDDIMSLTKKKGIDATEVVLSKSLNQGIQVRMGKIEESERAEQEILGLKIRLGQKEAAITTNGRTMAVITPLVDKLLAMARVVPDNPFAGEAMPAQLYKPNGQDADLQTFDPTDLSPEAMQAMAKQVEEAARGQKNIVNSEGAGASFGHEQEWFAFSNGFRGAESHSYYSLGVSIIAGDGNSMEAEGEYSSKVFFADLMSPEKIGQRAAARAAAQLGARQEKSGQYPVILEPRIATSIIGNLASAINGQKLAKGTSFLQDKLGQQVMASNITMVDDPLQRRGFASQRYDGEGLPAVKRNIIDSGVLTTYVLDLASARQLKMSPTGHARRSLTGVHPALSNVHIAAGDVTPDDLMADIKEGFYVTSVMGFGVNGVTGDYSQGASGFWIVNGKKSHSVNEMTIAGNLKDMFMHITPANDLEFLHHHNAPTLRIDGMTVAGK
ncbi:MAG: TldD/PmbA family protein [Hydrotalea sp.]|nr:TldD/PmbA family protein [Hydrotalea sp.]